MIRLLPYNSFVRGADLSNFVDDFFDKSIQSSNGDIFKMDVVEKDNMYEVSAEMPGVNKEDIHLEIDNGTLTITVDEVKDNEEKKENYLHRERYQRSMKRGVYLGDVEEGNISASLNDGILQILVPKKTDDETKKHIEIE